MDLYIYESPKGHVADFRPYLDGRDHSFDDHRALNPEDPRWEKINNLRDPVRGDSMDQLHFVGKSQIKWHELTLFPIYWDGEFEPVEWES